MQGVYFTPREIFYGDVVMCIPAKARTHVSLVDGPEHMPRDAQAFERSREPRDGQRRARHAERFATVAAPCRAGVRR